MIARVAAVVMLVVGLSPVPAQAQEKFEREADGFDFAVNMAFAPDGTIFVVDKDVGEILIVRDGQIVNRPFATVAADSKVNETGLLGIALHPDFPQEPWVYAYYSDVNDGRNRLVRFRADGDVAAERETLLDLLPTTFGWHNGGDITFGPDGKLYVAVGEGHVAERSQETNGLGGRILRLNPDGSIPADNPFGSDNPTFALGIRNSFGLCFDPSTGELWETENGPTEWDEVNLIEAGGNYGWPEHLGPGGEPEFVAPVLAFRETIVPTGCAGTPSNAGLFFGEGYSGKLHRMQLASAAGARPHDEIVGTFEGGITDVAAAPDGTIWVVTPHTIFRSAEVLLPAPGPTVSGGATGATGETAGAETGATGPTASAAPSGGGGLSTGAGIAVALVLVGGLLLMRSRLLRR